MTTDLKTCCICNDTFTGWGNNPEPFKGQTCCDDCNDRFVVPTRMCLGRGFNDESILMLLQTVAELGRVMRQITKDSVAAAMKGEPANGDPRKPF